MYGERERNRNIRREKYNMIATREEGKMPYLIWFSIFNFTHDGERSESCKMSKAMFLSER